MASSVAELWACKGSGADVSTPESDDSWIGHVGRHGVVRNLYSCPVCDFGVVGIDGKLEDHPNGIGSEVDPPPDQTVFEALKARSADTRRETLEEVEALVEKELRYVESIGDGYGYGALGDILDEVKKLPRESA